MMANRYVNRYLVVALSAFAAVAVMLGWLAAASYEGRVPSCSDVDTAAARVCAVPEVRPFTATDS